MELTVDRLFETFLAELKRILERPNPDKNIHMRNVLELAAVAGMVYLELTGELEDVQQMTEPPKEKRQQRLL